MTCGQRRSWRGAFGGPTGDKIASPNCAERVMTRISDLLQNIIIGPFLDGQIYERVELRISVQRLHALAAAPGELRIGVQRLHAMRPAEPTGVYRAESLPASLCGACAAGAHGASPWERRVFRIHARSRSAVFMVHSPPSTSR